MASLLKAQRECDLTSRLRYLARPALLIVDELRYLPLEPAALICSSNWSTYATRRAP